MSLLVGCPVILPPKREILASWTHRPHLLIVNGADDEWMPLANERTGLLALNADPPQNVGVARSWNVIFEQARLMHFSHVALIAQGTRLDGGTARLAALVDEWADDRGLLTDFAWHCIVLSVKTWEKVGRFDEQFWPAYYEDNDYVRRLELAGIHTPDHRIPKLSRLVLSGTETTAETLTAGLIPAGVYGANATRYEEKWGGPPGHERFIVPYGTHGP